MNNALITRRPALLLLLAVVIVAGSGCRRSRAISQKKEPLRDRPSLQVMRNYERNEFRFDWLGMKVDADMSAKGESRGFKANLRMRRDSVIWISLTPALGIEVFRVLLTPDSVKYISRVPDDKHFFLGSFQSINQITGIDLDFSMLQDMLLGNAIGLDREEGRFRSEVDGDNYLLTSRYRRKVRRVVGVDERKLSQEDTIVVNPADPRYRRSLRRADEDDLIISRYWLDGQNFRLVRSIFNDLARQRSLELQYSDFQSEENGQYYPTRCRLIVREPEQQQEISFRITKIATGKTYDFPFEIPNDFVRKLSP